MAKNDVTGWTLLSGESDDLSIITFSEAVDNVLDGGIPTGMVTEVFGDKVVGKTTLCYQLCVDVQISKDVADKGLASESLFIDTEQSFVYNRVEVLAQECVNHCNNVSPKCSLSVESLMNGIHVLKCSDVDMLLKILRSVGSYIKINPKIKLLVIDSLAFLFYAKDHDFQNRSKTLYSVSKELNELAYKYGLAIVVTNLMTTRFTTDTGKEYLIPFLGETWGYEPNLRLHLNWNGRSRAVNIVKSSFCKAAQSAPFRITHQGIRD